MYVGSKLNCLADAVFSESRPSAAIMVHGGLYCLSFPLLLGSCCIVNVTVFKVFGFVKIAFIAEIICYCCCHADCHPCG